MSKICKTCNIQVDDSANVCPNCGTRFEEVNVAPQQSVVNEPIVNTEALKSKAGDVAGKAKGFANELASKMKGDKVTLVAVGALAVIVLVFLVSYIGNFIAPGHSVVRSYYSAYKKEDAEKMVKFFHKKFYDDEDDLIEDYEDEFEDMEDEDYKILKAKVVESQKYSEDTLEDFAETLDSYYDIDEDSVEAVKDVYVRLVIDNDGENMVKYVSETVVKIDGKWYLTKSSLWY